MPVDTAKPLDTLDELVPSRNLKQVLINLIMGTIVRKTIPTILQSNNHEQNNNGSKVL